MLTRNLFSASFLKKIKVLFVVADDEHLPFFVIFSLIRRFPPFVPCLLLHEWLQYS